jgi:hypothetical protein
LLDLRLGVAGDHVTVALLDEIDSPLQRFRRRRSLERHVGKEQRADTADDE